MDAYALHLAVASLAAISAHRKTLVQLLDFALAAEMDRGNHWRLSRPHRQKRPARDRRSDVADAEKGVDGPGGEEVGCPRASCTSRSLIAGGKRRPNKSAIGWAK